MSEGKFIDGTSLAKWVLSVNVFFAISIGAVLNIFGLGGVYILQKDSK